MQKSLNLLKASYPNVGVRVISIDPLTPIGDILQRKIQDIAIENSFFSDFSALFAQLIVADFPVPPPTASQAVDNIKNLISSSGLTLEFPLIFNRGRFVGGYDKRISISAPGLVTLIRKDLIQLKDITSPKNDPDLILRDKLVKTFVVDSTGVTKNVINPQ